MPLSCKIRKIPDPDARGSALRLKGDWIFVFVTDGDHQGVGEATHSGDDETCAKIIRRLCDQHLKNFEPTLKNIQKLEETLSEPENFIEATAISALNQALYELLARKMNIPVWKLLVEKPVQDKIIAYTTINRCLRTRNFEDYQNVIREVKERGFRHFKCAPFEKVTPNGDQTTEARDGLKTLSFLKMTFPELSLRIDFHQRFTAQNFFSILPEIQSLAPHWIEEPFPLDDHYANLMKHSSHKIAVGELYFGTEKFKEIINNHWGHVIMPDIKHVGGFGPLLKVCELVTKTSIEVSPHNPSGPISTLASIHAGAISPNITSVEYPFDKGAHRQKFLEPFHDGFFTIPQGPGWGIDFLKSSTEIMKG
jgi:galactonate dehydratase